MTADAGDESTNADIEAEAREVLGDTHVDDVLASYNDRHDAIADLADAVADENSDELVSDILDNLSRRKPFDVPGDVSKWVDAKCPECGNPMTVPADQPLDERPLCPQGCAQMTDEYDWDDDDDPWKGYDVLRSDEPETVYQIHMDKTEEATPDEHGVLTDDNGNGYGTQGWEIVDDS